MEWPAYMSNMCDVSECAARLVAQHEAQHEGITRNFLPVLSC